MPTNVAAFPLWRMTEAFERALKTINQADGYNTTPTVQMGARTMDHVQSGDFPHVAFTMGDMTPDLEQLGVQAPSHGIIRYVWPAYVAGFVRTSGNRRQLYEAGCALLVDILAAVYQDETLPDAAGHGTCMLILPGEIAFDMESFATDGRGWFMAEFGLVADIERSGTP